MTFSQFLSILKARKFAALAVLLLTVLITIVISLVLPKQYTASSAVVVDVKSPDPIAGMVLAGMMQPGYMATQVDIITSDRVSMSVVQSLRLTENAELRQKWMDETEGRGDLSKWIADLLEKKLDVKPSRESNVINVSYTAPDPKFAAALANAFVKAYLETSLALRTDPARRYNTYFDGQAQDLRKQLEAAQGKLSEYQKAHGILATDERLDVETQRLNELVSQLVAAQSLTADSRSRSAQARTQADQLQDVINNPVVAGLRADISRQEAKLQELSSRYGEAHPQVQEAKANLASLRARMETETRRVSSSVGISNSINTSREADVRAALEAQRQKVLQMKAQRDEVAVLLHDVQVAQAAYDAVAQRQTQSSLESQANLTNISVLTPAVEPSLPSFPRIPLNIALSIFLGGLLALGTTLVLELADRRVRTLADISEVLGVPVLGTLPKPGRGLQGAKAPLLLPGNVMARLPGSSR